MQKSVMHGNRIESVDMLRGVMILLMVMGHIGYGDGFDVWIHAFHMPAFFFITGYFFQVNTNGVLFLKNKARRLIVPYIATALGTFVLWVLVEGRKDVTRILPMFKNILWVNTREFPVAGALWFLTALFCAEILFRIILKGTNATAIRILFLAIGCLSGYGISQLNDVRLPWAADVSLMALGFIGAGYYFKQNKNVLARFFQMSWKWFLLLIVAANLLIAVNGYVNMKFLKYGNPILFYINGTFSLLLWWNGCKKYCRWAEKSWIAQKGKDLLAYLGRTSLIYLCFNEIVIRVVQMAEEKFQIPLFGIALSVVNTIIVLVLIRCVATVIDHSFLKFFFGKKREAA